MAGLSSTIRFVFLICTSNENQLEHLVILLSCTDLFLFCRGWEQAHQRKGGSTSQILRCTGKILFGKMTKMGRPLSWHSVRRR